MLRALFNGLVQSIRQWRMALLMLIVTLLVAIPLSLPAFWLIKDTTRGTAVAERMMADQLDPIWLIDVANGQLSGVSIDGFGQLFVLLLIWAGIAYQLLHTLLAGGVVSLLIANDRHFRMWDFWAGSGLYFWRFFRLMLISRVLQGLVLAGTLVWLRRLGDLSSVATAYSDVVRKEWGTAIGLLLIFGLIGMIFDYARIRTVANGATGMLRETLRATAFIFCHPLSTIGLQVTALLLGLSLFAGLVWLRALIPQSSGARVLAAFMIGQLAIGVRLWHRVWITAAQIELSHHFVAQRRPDETFAEEYIEPDTIPDKPDGVERMELPPRPGVGPNPGLPD